MVFWNEFDESDSMAAALDSKTAAPGAVLRAMAPASSAMAADETLRVCLHLLI
jgi:hypothetical protein